MSGAGGPSPGLAWSESGEELDEVRDPRLVVALAPQPSLDVEQAAEVAAHDGLHAALADVLALVGGHARGDVAQLHREGAAEATALLAFVHLVDRGAGLPEERARRALHAQ